MRSAFLSEEHRSLEQRLMEHQGLHSPQAYVHDQGELIQQMVLGQILMQVPEELRDGS